MPEQRYQPTDAPADAEAITRDDLSSGTFLYPAKLVEVRKVMSEPRDKSRKPVQQLYQVFERQDEVWADGNPVQRRNRLNLQFQSKETGEIETMWEGSEVDQVGEAFDGVCGCDMFADNPDTAAFIGHFFMVESVKVPDTDKLYLQVPREYLGDDYKFGGNVRTRESQNQDGAQAAEAPPADNAEHAARLADLMVGMTEEDVRGGAVRLIAQQDEALKGVQVVLGVSLKGGLLQPKAILLDKLVAGGFVTIDEGTIMLGAGAES